MSEKSPILVSPFVAHSDNITILFQPNHKIQIKINGLLAFWLDQREFDDLREVINAFAERERMNSNDESEQ